MRSAIRGSSRDWNSNRTSRYSHRSRWRTCHTASPWRLTSSSLTYSTESFSSVEKSISPIHGPATNPRSRSSTMRGKAQSFL